MQFIYRYFLWDHWTHSGYFDNRIPLKAEVRGRIQPRKLQWRDLKKPNLGFLFFCVVFVSKGNLLDFYFSKRLMDTRWIRLPPQSNSTWASRFKMNYPSSYFFFLRLFLRGTDSVSGEASLSKLFCLHSEKGSILKGKNLFLLGANIFL